MSYQVKQSKPCKCCLPSEVKLPTHTYTPLPSLQGDRVKRNPPRYHGHRDHTPSNSHSVLDIDVVHPADILRTYTHTFT